MYLCVITIRKNGALNQWEIKRKLYFVGIMDVLSKEVIPKY